nr:ABC transporter ATP-binding protein [Anaerolineae bacterium]
MWGPTFTANSLQWGQEKPVSETAAIEFDCLGKVFGRGHKQVRAVHNVTLAIPPGLVYGFLGPNGAGKTTTIRMIMSLIRPTSGTVSVFGKDVLRRHDILKRVGSLVEDATFYTFLSGRKNLEVLARTGDEFNPARIADLLGRVGLADDADRKVKGYSTGMKQRLGLAAALLNDPDLVILDEPTNGLDPAGIQEMRHFIRSLAHTHGKTVFLSSHLLTEVEQVCDRVAIIDQGEIVREGVVSELLSSKLELRVEANPLDKAAELLQEHHAVTRNDTWLSLEAAREATPAIIKRLVDAGIAVYEVSIRRQTLEDYFLAATGNKDGHHD